MPRPGPRPYECVRRAWHSDRHQPMRGSLIQEIFRLVSEVHCSATRKNREWQEKLPIVVLKAEEIMYSKANSEAEYSNLKTLWDRVTDAINTIIRRDESTETDQKFLQPCIEAALQLGCTPRRSSRSQRNESPRCYLHPENLGNTSVPNNNSISKLYHNHKTISPLMLHCPQLSTLDTMNPLNSCSKGYYNNNFQNRAPDWTKKFAVLPNNFVPSDNHHHVSAQACPSSTTWSAYPLYYNNQIQPDGSNIRSSKPSNSSSRLDASEFVFPFSHENGSSKVQEVECDLTLRLGTLAAPRGGIETSWPSQVDNGDRCKFKSHLNK